jgi:predicted dehydrogenase
MATMRMAQFGTEHGHAEGKLRAMLADPEVEVAGVWEPDPERREALRSKGDPWRAVGWYQSAEDMLGDESIAAVASEGPNHRSLDDTEAILEADKHVWYDKPAGEDWPRWQRLMALAKEQALYVQMGYMFRYHPGFARIAEWAHSGALGDVYAARAHMSTCIDVEARQRIARYRGGIFYDLAGHMLDQIVWLLGRPQAVTSFLRHDDAPVPGFVDNTLSVLEFDGALAHVDIAAMEPRPVSRRYEVYGTRGSAILVEPFEPGERLRLCLAEPVEGLGAGEHSIDLPGVTRQALYERELRAFIGVLRGEREPDRPPEHELLVQETLLRCTGVLDL